jgi:hypothetical protein
MPTDKQVNLEKELKLIGEEWDGSVYVTYRPKYDEWQISNKTDEGLPVDGKRITITEPTLKKAIESVKNN